MRNSTQIVVGRLAAPALLALAAAACGGGGGDAEPPPTTSPPTTVEAASTEPRVFFVSPQDGAEVASPVSMEFGAENVTVAPIEDPLVARPGEIHHHIGIDTECLPPGEVIPTADPWVHFGDASAVFETQLDAGPHTLVLQAGDGEHRTLEGEGYCDVIEITVVEEGEAEESDAGESDEEAAAQH